MKWIDICNELDPENKGMCEITEYRCPLECQNVFAINDQKKHLRDTLTELRRIQSTIGAFPLRTLAFEDAEQRSYIYDMIDGWLDGYHKQVDNLKEIVKIAYNQAEIKDGVRRSTFEEERSNYFGNIIQCHKCKRWLCSGHNKHINVITKDGDLLYFCEPCHGVIVNKYFGGFAEYIEREEDKQ